MYSLIRSYVKQEAVLSVLLPNFPSEYVSKEIQENPEGQKRPLECADDGRGHRERHRKLV